jgi:hypothetical protein
VDVDRSLRDVPVVPSGQLQQLLAGEYPLRFAGQHHQQFELPGRALDPAPAHRDLMADRIHDEIIDPQLLTGSGVDRDDGPLSPSEQGADPGHQLSWAAGFGQIVVGAEIQPEQEIGLGRPGRHHQDRDVVVGPQDPADVQSIDPGHHQIEDEQVRLMPTDLIDRSCAVLDDDGGVPFAFQVAANEFGVLDVVLTDQNPGTHGVTIRDQRQALILADRILTSPSHLPGNVPDMFTSPRTTHQQSSVAVGAAASILILLSGCGGDAGATSGVDGPRVASVATTPAIDPDPSATKEATAATSGASGVDPQLRLDSTKADIERAYEAYYACWEEKGVPKTTVGGQTSVLLTLKMTGKKYQKKIDACASQEPRPAPELDPATNPKYWDQLREQAKCVQAKGLPLKVISGTPGLFVGGQGKPKDYDEVNSARGVKIIKECEMEAFAGKS